MVANEVLNRPDLSLKAKGLFSYLFSKPDDWDFSADRIVLDMADGRYAILQSLKELEKARLLRRVKNGDGRVEYLLEYSSVTQSAKTELRLFPDPKCNNRTVQKLHSAKIDTISNKDSVTNKEGESKKESVFSLETEIKKMEESPRRDINIIALYLDVKKPDLKSKEQLSVAIKRHLRPARLLQPFTDDQIMKGVEKAKKLTSEWTIETITKCLTK